MAAVRHFVLASSLARLVRKERGSSRVTEGYFPGSSGRTSSVVVEGSQCHLVLTTSAPGEAPSEERTEVPRAHADALLDVCGGKVVYDRSRLNLPGGREALIDRITVPGNLDLVSVAFGNGDEAEAFQTPAWFGPEVTEDEAYGHRAVALDGLPRPADIPLSNAALEALLDLVENRFSASRLTAPSLQGQRLSSDDTRVMDALRRLAGGAEARAGATTAAVTTVAAVAAANRSPEPFESAAADEDEAAAPMAMPEMTPFYVAAAPSSSAGQEEHGAETAADDASPPAEDGDERIDDVLHGLSQVLESYGDAKARTGTDSSVVEVNKWGGGAARGRRSEG